MAGERHVPHRTVGIAVLILANVAWATLVTVLAQSVEDLLFRSVNQWEYLYGTASGATFALATWLILSRAGWAKKACWTLIIFSGLATTYLGLDWLYRRFLDFSFGLGDPLGFAVMLSVTLTTAFTLIAVLKGGTVRSGVEPLPLNSTARRQFTIRQLLAWTALFAVYCGVLRLLVPANPFAPVTNSISGQMIVSLRWHFWFSLIGAWALFPFSWAITRRRRLSTLTWTLVLVGNIAAIITAFPLFTLLGRYLNGVWNNPQVLLYLNILLPYLIGFIATATANLIALSRLGLLHSHAAAPHD